MRKLLSIAAWFFLFISLAVVAASAFGASATSADFPRYFPGRRLADFNARVRQFRAAPPPRTVIVGTCYALGVETPGESYNLSIEASSPYESFLIAKAYCSPQDRLIIPITVAGIYRIPPNSLLPPRRETFNDIARNLQLARMSAYQAAGIRPPGLGLNAAERTALYNRNFATIRSFDLSVYHQIHEQFPNTVFVLFPTMPTEKLADQKATLRRHLEASGLTFINIEDVLGFKHFTDTIHTTPEGKAIIRAQIQAQALASLDASSHPDPVPARP